MSVLKLRCVYISQEMMPLECSIADYGILCYIFPPARLRVRLLVSVRVCVNIVVSTCCVYVLRVRVVCSCCVYVLCVRVVFVCVCVCVCVFIVACMYVGTVVTVYVCACWSIYNTYCIVSYVVLIASTNKHNVYNTRCLQL